MLDHETGASEDQPETKLEADGDGANKPPRKTAVGSSGPGRQPWVPPSKAQPFLPIAPSSIYELLQLQDDADFEVMSRAHAYLYHRLDTSYFQPDAQKIQQQGLLKRSWDAWCRSAGGRKAKAAGALSSAESWDNLTHYQLLQVLPTAEISLISAVHQCLSRRYHADNTATADNEKFELLNNAWDVLSDRSSRLQYDQLLKPTIK